MGQLGDLIDRNLLWDTNADAENRHEILVSYLKNSFGRRHLAPDHDFAIIHGARDKEGIGCVYAAWCIRFDAKRGAWSDTKIHCISPGGSQVLATLGSGQSALRREIRLWAESPQGGTARSIFSAFCDALSKKQDKLSGGVPQIVTIGRKGGGKVAGFVTDGERYLYGLPVEPSPLLEEIEWYDPLFTRMSPTTLKRLSNTQRHVRVDQVQPGGFMRSLNK